MCWRRRCPELNRQYIKNTYSIEFWLVIGFFLSVRSLFFASNIFSLLQIYHNIKWNALKPITEKSTPHSNKAWNSFINYLFQLQMKYLTYLNLRCSKNHWKCNSFEIITEIIQNRNYRIQFKKFRRFFCFGYIELYHLTAITEMTIASNNILWLVRNPFGCHSFETMHHILRHPPTASRLTKKITQLFGKLSSY